VSSQLLSYYYLNQIFESPVYRNKVYWPCMGFIPDNDNGIALKSDMGISG